MTTSKSLDYNSYYVKNKVYILYDQACTGGGGGVLEKM